MRTLVVIPTYNEAESIGALVEQVVAADQAIDALVVDDGSPDGTADIVRKTMAGEPRLHLLERSAKEGLRAAYRAGFRWGLARDYDALVETCWRSWRAPIRPRRRCCACSTTPRRPTLGMCLRWQGLRGDRPEPRGNSDTL